MTITSATASATAPKMPRPMGGHAVPARPIARTARRGPKFGAPPHPPAPVPRPKAVTEDRSAAASTGQPSTRMHSRTAAIRNAHCWPATKTATPTTPAGLSPRMPAAATPHAPHQPALRPPASPDPTPGPAPARPTSPLPQANTHQTARPETMCWTRANRNGITDLPGSTTIRAGTPRAVDTISVSRRLRQESPRYPAPSAGQVRGHRAADTAPAQRGSAQSLCPARRTRWARKSFMSSIPDRRHRSMSACVAPENPPCGPLAR